MKYYQDITLLPDPEIDLYFLWKKVYQQMHLALVEVKDTQDKVNIGFSWPNYVYSENRKHLGNKLRVFAQSSNELCELDLNKWLSRLTDYAHITKIRNVPDNVNEHVKFSRVRVKSGIERIARRKAKRQSISYEDALSQLSHFKTQQTDLPFVRFESLSKGHSYPLFISKAENKTAEEGKYSTYGLSKTATVPWF